MTEPFEKLLEVSELYLKDGRTSATRDSLLNRQRTLTSYIRALDECGEDPGIAGVLKWKQSLVDSGLKKSTIHQYLVELRCFYTWAIDHGFFTDNPVKPSDMPRVVKNPYQLMSEDQMLRLLQRVDPRDYRKDRVYWLRNRAIVVTLITTSIRNGELMDLTLSDLDWDGSEILIRSGKGGKDRYVDFPEITKAAIGEYWSAPEMPKDPSPDMPVFLAFDKKTGAPRRIDSRKSLSTYVKRYVSHMLPEYEKDVRSHALRHVGASLLLTNGDSLEQIQNILGHACQSTTKIYAARLRPDKSHVQNANRIWDELAYQTGASVRAFERAREKRARKEENGPEPENPGPAPSQPRPETDETVYDGSRNLFGEAV